MTPIVYMYIDYDGYFYPKALISFKQLKFPDELGNSLSSILLNNTGFHGKSEEYKNCIILQASNKNGWFKYVPYDIYLYLKNFTYYKHKGILYDIVIE